MGKNPLKVWTMYQGNCGEKAEDTASPLTSYSFSSAFSSYWSFAFQDLIFCTLWI